MTPRRMPATSISPIGPGDVEKTITYQRMDVGLDNNDQIINLRLYESEACRFQSRLEYALQYSEVEYEPGNRLIISFAVIGQEERSIAWDANIDLDKSGQVLGIEVLYADLNDDPEDGQERLHAEGRLDHLSKYFIPFEELH